MGNAILHAFNWKFNEITNAAKEISALGYSGVLVSPPSFSEGQEWFYRYQPIDYRIIYSPLGDLKEFTSMIDTLKSNNLKVYIDIVFNHMAYREDNNLNYPGDHYLQKYKNDNLYASNCLYGDISKNVFHEQDFNPKSCIESSDYDDPNKVEDVQNDRICDERVKEGLPDLNHHSENVVHAQQEYLKALKKIGVSGFRIDAAKHIPIEHIKKVFTKEITLGLFIFGEIIPAHHGKFLDEFLSEVDFSAYDFNLFYSIHEAITKEGSLEKLAAPNQLNPFKSLTFVITHDIPNNEAMRMFIFDAADNTRSDEKFAYAYILSRDGGVPLIYSDKGEEDGVYSNLWKNAYKDPALKIMIDFHNQLFGKKMEVLSAGKCHLIFHREGAGIAVFNKCADQFDVEVDAVNIPGKFKNIVNDNIIEILSDKFSFKLPPRSYQLFLKD